MPPARPGVSRKAKADAESQRPERPGEFANVSRSFASRRRCMRFVRTFAKPLLPFSRPAKLTLMLSSVKLVVVSGEVKTKELSIKLPSTIGRGRATAVILPHPLVSRNHCELYETDGRLMVRDLGSLNGTYVNNERVTEAPLDPGDSLTVGTVTFRAEYDAPRQPEDEPKTRMIKKKSEKTVRVNKDGSPVARPKSQPIVEESDDELLDVDF